MTPADYIAIGALLLILGVAIAYIVRAKRSGQKCIGCPYSSTCSGGTSCGCSQRSEDEDAQ